jgi:hypothetical protein
MKDTRLVVIKNGHHNVHYTHPQAVAQHIHDFIALYAPSLAITSLPGHELSFPAPPRLEFTGTKDSVTLVTKAISELIGWYGDPMASAKGAIVADPKCCMAYVFIAGLEIIASGTPMDSKNISEPLDKLAELLGTGDCNRREKLHYKALDCFRRDQVILAADTWEGLLLEYPNDTLGMFHHLLLSFG